MAKNKAVEILQNIRGELKEVDQLIQKMEVEKKVGEKYVITKEYEQSALEIQKIREGMKDISNNKRDGSLDLLEEGAKERVKEFFQKHFHQKKYEGDYVSIGYRVVERKDITGIPDERFVTMTPKPNTEAINEYMRATISDKNPDGKLPEGISLKTFEYINFKIIGDGEL